MNYNYRLKMSYDGSAFHGWQRQNLEKNTIQELLETQLEEILGEVVKVQGSGRTDSGVHAKGQVANFHVTKRIDAVSLRDLLNQRIPDSIRILEAKEVAVGFHSRLCAKGKTYCYQIDRREKPGVFTRKYAYHYPHKLNVEAMRKGASYLIGTHDFRGFSMIKEEDKSTLRQIKEIRIQEKGDYLQFYFTGHGFLYHQVRIMAGTLLEIGLGERNAESVKQILDSKIRKEAGFMAPAQGLCLMEVYY